MIPFEKANFLVLGLARDCEFSLPGFISSFQYAFSDASRLEFLIVESDSVDNTCGVLLELQRSCPNISFRSLGNLSRSLPLRTQRIAYCRNFYLKEVERLNLWSKFHYFVVADLDGVNRSVTRDAVRSCWDRDDWAVCTANQDGPYYDIWALRHPAWSPNDCWKQAKFLERHGVHPGRSRLFSVYCRMIKVLPSEPWIEVESAFGGLAIYKSRYLRGAEYIGVADDGEEVCEHVSVHSRIRSMGGRIFLNPRMINAGLVPHAYPAFGAYRVYMRFRSKMKNIILGFCMFRMIFPPIAFLALFRASGQHHPRNRG